MVQLHDPHDLNARGRGYKFILDLIILLFLKEMSALKSISFIMRTSRSQIFKQYGLQQEVFRGLYSASSLGIDGFLQQKERVKNQLTNIQEKFKAKMIEHTQEESKGIIFTEDLKNMIHIAEESDIEVVIKMMKKFNKQNKELRFGNYIFGSVVMRMFHILNKHDEALECFKSPELEGFFDQVITYQLLCDLLYENKRYNQIIECFEIIKERQIEGTKYPRNIVVLVFAACYKMNTAEGLKYAMDLWNELSKVGHLPARRAATFFAGLLLKHNKPEICLEVVSGIKNQNYTTVRNLKVLALAKVNRLDQIIPILKSILNQEQVQTFNRDVLDTVKECIDKGNDTELRTEYEHIMKIFTQQNHISDTTLDEQLTSEITSARFVKQSNQDRNQYRFQSKRLWKPRQSFQRNERVALQDMD